MIVITLTKSGLGEFSDVIVVSIRCSSTTRRKSKEAQSITEEVLTHDQQMKLLGTIIQVEQFERISNTAPLLFLRKQLDLRNGKHDEEK